MLSLLTIKARGRSLLRDTTYRIASSFRGESIRSYGQRFFEIKEKVTNLSDSDVIDYWINGFYRREDTRQFGQTRPKTMQQLRDMIKEWVDSEDQERIAHDQRQ